MAEPEQPNQGNVNQEWTQSYLGQSQPGLSAFGRPMPRRRRKSPLGSILMLIVLAFLGVAGYYFYTNQKQTNAKNALNDLGQGISTASGIRGHLVTRFEQGKTKYMLKIEPIDPRQAEEFATVTGIPTKPMSITVRVLDSSGFALCGKEILLPFDPAKAASANAAHARGHKVDTALSGNIPQLMAQEHAREQGHDMFRNIYGDDGKVVALWAEGTLPCSPDQYARSDYWDLVTDFPTLAEQDQAMNRNKPAEKPLTPAERRAARIRAWSKTPEGFFIEGDDHATAYEPARAILWAGPGRRFAIIKKTDQTVAASWAEDDSLIHYKCDKHAGCALNRAGSATIVLARMEE